MTVEKFDLDIVKANIEFQITQIYAVKDKTEKRIYKIQTNAMIKTLYVLELFTTDEYEFYHEQIKKAMKA
jgi:hypothetical protein